MNALAHADYLQRGPNGVGIILCDAGDDGVGIAHPHHHGSEDVPVVHLLPGRGQRDPAALTQAVKLLSIFLAAGEVFRVD